MDYQLILHSGFRPVNYIVLGIKPELLSMSFKSLQGLASLQLCLLLSVLPSITSSRGWESDRAATSVTPLIIRVDLDDAAG